MIAWKYVCGIMILQVYVLRDCEEEDQEEMEEYDVLDQTDIEFKE